ncbi:MAG: LysM peptidoglycan-binding domain-containing protein [Gemmatimonadota bacterium]
MRRVRTMGSDGWLAARVLAVAVLAACGAARSPVPAAPGTGVPAAAESPTTSASSTADPSSAPADTSPAADARGAAAMEEAEREGVDARRLDVAAREALTRVERLDEQARREFLELFGSDPLGLESRPANAARYEIPLEINDSVDRWIDYFQHRVPDRFATYLTRAGRYESMIRSKLREARLPGDLLYLAMIESGMNPSAYSRAHAVGMWQFISGTARRYDLEVSYWVDERRDPIKSTDAAIRHLSDLHDELGSWYLAAAAYNGGLGRVRRGIRRTGSRDFWDLADARVLRRETRNYVPKLIAAAIIARDPGAYGFEGIVPEEPMTYDVVEVPDATSFDVIARASGASESEVRRLNPQFLRNVTPPGRRSDVRVPRGRGDRFAVAYGKIPASERVTWLVHTVTRGQTLSHIAMRYGTTVTAIRAANRNVNPRRLQIGQRLVVPRAAPAGAGLRTAGLPAGPADGPLTVTVRRGDTLWTIARRYRTTTRELKAMNHLQTDLIRPGDRLTVRR